MADTADWINALRASHDRFAAVVRPLDAAAAAGPSYDTDWSIGQVASHLGSQAEIFGLFLEAGLAGTPAPGPDAFAPIWDRWNALPAAQQVTGSIAANEAFVSRMEKLPAAQRDSFALALFGGDFDLAGLAAMRLGEHALHTWDVAVALDSDAVVAADVVDLLIEMLPGMVARAGKPDPSGRAFVIETSAPDQSFTVVTGPDVSLAPGSGPADLHLPGEALVRLVFGRLDPEHTPAGASEETLTVLRKVFPGF
jgi:uncharacterized protein (TIGR03083 family)